MAMYPFSTLADETEVTHSHLKDENGVKVVEIHFERPKEGGFDSARCKLPNYEWVMRNGFEDSEIEMFESMLRRGAHLFYKYAEIGGLEIAKAI